MEEIDNIILETLKHLECDINFDELQSLKQFDADAVLNAVSTCLETIKPGQSFPKKMPPSMSQKLRIATDLAQHIKALGFRGDMGYQTILYCNEVEVRRVLMFLIERLPRDTSKTLVPIEQTGYVPRLVKEIENNLKKYTRQVWVPASLLAEGVRECSGGFLVNSFGNSCPPQPQSLVIPDNSKSTSELKQYWVHVVPDVTKQCSNKQLIPSLLFNDNKFDRNEFMIDILKQNHDGTTATTVNKLELIPNDIPASVVCKEAVANATAEEPQNAQREKFASLLSEIEAVKTKYKSLQDAVKTSQLELVQVKELRESQEQQLKTTQSAIKLKTKTLAVMKKEENLIKLKKMVEDASEHLVDLANQWNKVQAPLLDEYKSLHNIQSSEEIKQREDEAKLDNLRSTRKKLLEDLKEKDQFEKILQQKTNAAKNNNRSSYTRRILETIGNIKKQNDEIQKVLKDTREVQKDINNLSGQVDRSFTLSDEIIFYDAKQDECARKSYKLLAALRDECGGILKAVNDLGLTERECRNLEEQVETEKAKEMGDKLERVSRDLEEIKKETQMLLKGQNKQ